MMSLVSAIFSPPPQRAQRTVSGPASARSAANRSSAGKAIGKSKAGSPTVRAPSKPKRPPKIKRTALEIVAEFVRKAETNGNDVLIGIDPGTTGAIAFKCRKDYCVVDIPRTESKRKRTRRMSRKERQKTGRKSKTVMATDREPDLATIIALFRLLKPVKRRVHVILEKIPPTIGKRGRKYAEIMLNRAYAMWPLFLTSKGYTFHQEKPSVWKESFSLLGTDKDVSRLKAISLYPSADIVRKKDHDRADALLLVEYLRRKLAGKGKT